MTLLRGHGAATLSAANRCVGFAYCMPARHRTPAGAARIHRMPLDLSPLPYEPAALAPHLPPEAIEHRRRAQQAHLDAIKATLDEDAQAGTSLEQLAREARGALAAHAVEAWSDAFLWTSLTPPQPGMPQEPGTALAEALARAFGDVAGFRARFEDAARHLAGSGRLWLVQRRDGRLAIVATPPAVSPLTGQDTPLLVCPLPAGDEERARALAAFWPLVNWKGIAARMRGT